MTRTPTLRRWGVGLGGLLLAAALTPQAAAPPLATAQIDNMQPAQAYASVVDCIRSGADQGAISSFSPRFVTTCYASRLHEGGYNAPGGDEGNGDAAATERSIVAFGDATPDNSADLYDSPTNDHATMATVGAVGSTYGLAYQTGTNPAAPALARARRLFAGAYHKRLTRFGSGGPGAIYVIDRDASTTGVYVQIPAVVPGPVGAPGDAGDGSLARFPNDPAGNNAFTPEMGGLHRSGDDDHEEGYVGKAGLGDVELDAQERYLYTVNLNTRKVIRIDTWSASPQSTLTTMADPLALNPCASQGGSGNYRPFGLMLTSSALYLGAVCSGENGGDVAMRVDRLDLGTNSWSNALGTSLSAYAAQRGTWNGYNLAWNAWASNGGTTYSAPQPMVAGLALDEAGNLLIGLRDRYGDLSSNGRYVGGESQGASQGDLLIAPSNGVGGWGAPQSGAGETFDDGTSAQGSYPSGWLHGESTWGALDYVPGTHAGGYGGEVIATAISPYRSNAGGTAWWNTSSGGAATAREELYQTNSSDKNTFQKAAGLGDLELLCAWRVIGDRVWFDANGNGVQDAGENDINGVPLQLLDASGNVIANVTTGSVGGMSGNYRFYVDPFATYTVRVDGSAAALDGLSLTTPNAGGNDATDSDADTQGRIAIPTAGNHDINLTYDAGYVDGANVRVQKTGPALALRGEAVTYTIVATNDGPASATNVRVTDTLPTGLTYSGATPAPTSTSGQVLTWNLGTMAAGTSTTITVVATVGAASLGNYTNRADITTDTPNDTPGDNTTTTTVQVVRPSLSITKTGPAVAAAGSQLAYTLAYQNSGDAVASNATVVDTLPAGTSYLSASPAPTSVSGQTITWNLGTLAVGASGTITVQVRASASLADGSAVTNSAQITTTTSGDPPGDNTTTTTTQIRRADVAIQKTTTTTFPVTSGTSVTYYLDYSNRGGVAAANVTIADTVPSQITGVTWACETGCSASGSGNAISIAIGTLAAGATGRVRVTGTATTALAREDFTNTATIRTDTPETDTSNNTSAVPGAVWTSDVQLIKQMPPTAAAGAVFTATLTYQNSGPAPAAGVQLVDTLPTGTSYLSATLTPTSISGQTLTWNLGTLAAGTRGTITLTLRSDAALAAGTAITNTGKVTTTTPDRTPGNNTSTSTTILVTRADLAIQKTGPAQVTAGDDLDYTLSYRNSGPSLARGVVITDTLPSDLTFVRAVPAPTTNAQGVAMWAVGDLAPGASGVITVTMASDYDQLEATRAVTNTVAVGSPTPDPTPGNNTSTHTVAVETADLVVEKTMPATVMPGDSLVATLAYRNDGPAPATRVVLRDVAPEGLTVVATDPVATGPGLRWSLDLLPPGASGVVTVTFLVAPTAAPGTVYRNQAIISTPTADRDPTNDSDWSESRVIPRPITAVTLAYLMVACQADGNQVRWGTTAEQQTDHFRVERTTSASANGAKVIGTASSQGSRGGDYALWDRPPPEGRVYYWLIEVDANGREQRYGPVPSQTTTATTQIYLPLVQR
ncbi:DUF11 domain-containing protein [Chloroflexia bacterium SDU3-3]|nr:DUF11 domain-containing protein [Chloroflexia bacterium SDU3-3]